MKEYKGINVIEFSGEGCANCFSLMPVLNSVMKNYQDAELVHVEIGEDHPENAEIVNFFEVDRVPTVLVVKDNVEIARCRGYQPEEILELWLDSKIEDARKK